jgi:hypothetical protein
MKKGQVIVTTLRTYILCGVLSMFSTGTRGQDTTRAFTFSGYGEVYYGFDLNRPSSNERPSFVYTHNRHNEVNVNLALIKGQYTAERVRGTVALGAGTYMNAVYAAEPGVLKNLYEANVGVRLLKHRALWIDAGVLPSHLGFESAISTDCKTLTRSLVAENSPYYESGARLSYTTVTGKWYVAALMLNGWQRIQRPAGNAGMGAGTQVTYSPSEKATLNYSTFFGNDKPDSTKQYRFFHNVYAIAKVTSRISVTAGMDYGMEQQARGAATWNNWLGACAIIQYKPGAKWALAARGEYYEDDSGTIVKTGVPGGFRTVGFSANFDYFITENVLWRIEGKSYVSQAAIYMNGDGKQVATSPAAATSLCIHF